MASNSTIILAFHRVSDEFSPAYPPIPVKVFDKICKYLSRNYEIIHPHAIFDKKQSKKIKAIITFDDAYLDFYENALPILEKYKIPVIQHVITACAESGKPFWTQKLNKIIDNYYESQQPIKFEPLNINKRLKNKGETEQVALNIYKNLLANSHRVQFIEELEGNLKSKVKHTKMMTWEQIKEVASENIVIGSHTHSHSNLSELSKEKLTEELLKSKELIKVNLHEQEKLFLAYPNGQFNEKAVKTAKECGYDAAFTTEEQSFHTETNKFQIPRYLVYHNKWWKNYVRLKYQVK